MSHDVPWCPMMSHDVPWCPMMSHDVPWCPMMSHDVPCTTLLHPSTLAGSFGHLSLMCAHALAAAPIQLSCRKLNTRIEQTWTFCPRCLWINPKLETKLTRSHTTEEEREPCGENSDKVATSCTSMRKLLTPCKYWSAGQAMESIHSQAIIMQVPEGTCPASCEVERSASPWLKG